jgi:hypothetical protein
VTGKSIVQRERLSQGHRVTQPTLQCSEFYVAMFSFVPFSPRGGGEGRKEIMMGTGIKGATS